MKRISCFLMVAVMVVTLFGCNKKNAFTDEKAIEVIMESDYIESVCDDLDADDVEIEVLDNEVDEDEAKVKCKITYTGAYVSSEETVVVTLEKDDDEWEVDKVKSKKDLEHTPTKFPDKAKLVNKNGYPIIKASSVVNYYGEDEILTVYSGYEVSKITWEVIENNDDYTEGSVRLSVKFEDYSKILEYTGYLYFDDEIGKWNVSFSDGNYVDAGNNNNESGNHDKIDYGEGTIKIWASESCVSLTQSAANKFISEHPEYSGYRVEVEEAGENVAPNYVIDNLDDAADIYGFSQDQLERLVSAGALVQLDTYYANSVAANNDAGSVGAAMYGGETYAFPYTSDNGYLLYYDKNVISDPTSLEKMIEDCEDAGKNFYFELGNGWYQTSFFFATGCELTYETNAYGEFTKCNINYDSKKGLVALKEISDMSSSPYFVNSSMYNKANDVGFMVIGTWADDTMKMLLGDNYATAKLPTFVGSDGETYQLSGFGGYMLMGVKPQATEGKRLVCLHLAEYLTSMDVQLMRYEAAGYGPSNIVAQQSEAVQANPALSALAAQLVHTIPQGQYPAGYWKGATELFDYVYGADLSDDELKALLATFQEDAESFFPE